jgi:hypothetical protein
MSIQGDTSHTRRVVTFALATIFALPLITASAAMAQMQGTDSQATVAAHSSDAFSSSSAAVATSGDDADALTASPATGTAAGQSEGSYGYHSHSWTNRIAFEAGGGFNAPVGNDKPFITWGGNLTVGGGLHLSNHISLLAEYQFIDDKLPGALISEAGAQGGNAHIWSLTLDPVIDLFPKRKNDVYFTGGGGFYRKLTSFTDPEEIEICYYFCEVGTENVVVSHFSSNQGGLNVGMGITHKLGGDEHLKAFAEVRYLWINTPQIGDTDGLGRTELLPVTFGLRW